MQTELSTKRKEVLRREWRKQPRVKENEAAYSAQRYRLLKCDPEWHAKHLARSRISNRKSKLKRLGIEAGLRAAQEQSHSFKLAFIVALHALQNERREKHELAETERSKNRESARSKRSAALEIQKAESLVKKRARTREWRKLNRDKWNTYVRTRRATNPAVLIKDNIRRRIRKAIQDRATTSCTTLTLIGCSIEALLIHIESQFELGMSWTNYGVGDGKWTLDHIRPCASFDLTQDSERRVCFHFSNLRPSWFLDNCAKNSKVPGRDKAIRKGKIINNEPLLT